MKRRHKLTALFAVMGLLLSLWAPMAVAADTPEAVAAPPLPFGRSILAQMPNAEALCYAYDTVVDGCEAAQASIDISHATYRLSTDEAFLVYDAVWADCPAYFWLADGVQAGGYGNVVYTLYFEVPEDVATTRAALSARVAEMTAGLEGKSDYDKSRILHDRVCDAVIYRFSDNDQSVVGSLLEGASVCSGYARAYQLLLQAVGIPSFCVTGHSRGQNHAWNLVQLDGEWYYTDVTWDDQNDKGGFIYYAYLNNTYAQIEEDHTAVDFADYLPRSTATANNYHVKNGSTLASFDVGKVAALLRRGNPAHIYVTGDLSAFLTTLQTKLSDVAQQLVKSFSGYSCSFSYTGREVILSLNINHPHNYKTETVAPTCTDEGTVTTRCTDCGIATVETTPALGHSTAWVTDDTHHALLCTRCGREEESGEHVYDDDADDTCDTCGHIRVIVTVLPGDADGNGKVNNRDLGRLQQHLNEWVVTIDSDACDLDGNGRVNNRDLGLLQRLLNE